LQLSRQSAHSHISIDGQLDLLTGWEAWPSNQSMKVVYGVFTSPLPKYAQQLAAVEDTWAKDVPPQRLLVVGVNGSTSGVAYHPAPMCLDGHVTNAGISCKEATLLATGYEAGADWVVVIGSDNYVFPRHFEARLEKENAKIAQIFAIFGCGGGEYCEDGKSGICGGAGYAISRAALDKMIGKAESASENFVQESMTTASGVGGYWSDQVTSCIARRHHVKEVQLSGLYGWKLCPGDGALTCPFREELYRQYINDMSPEKNPLTFHYIAPEEMHTIHKMAHDAEAVQEMALLEMGELVTPGEMDGQVSSNSRPPSMLADSYDEQRAAYIQMMDKEVYRGNASVPAKSH